MRLDRVSLLTLAVMTAWGGVYAVSAQVPVGLDDPAALQRALADARTAGAEAGRRAARLEASARQAEAAVDATARQAASLAARIQQAEAEITAAEAQAGLIAREQAALRARLAERQQPLVQLTAALQRLSRRPTGFALLRPGSLRETVYLRATLDAMLPEIQRRTADLRAEIARGRKLQQQASANAAALRQGRANLAEQRKALVATEARQRLAARAAGGEAAREADRALALAEQARDLGGLLGQLEQAGQRRAALAALPGPILRPPQPANATVGPESLPVALPAERLSGFILPLAGRLVTGFGVQRPGQPLSRGVTLAARPRAQIVAPAAGRVAFAGPYRGYGQIVIIEHPGGWTSLVTGLAVLDVAVGDALVAGSPLGQAGGGNPLVTLELRKGGQPVNPLDQLGG
jgi:septal ring factor EnvC (AmiA/AmiB activator)